MKRVLISGLLLMLGLIPAAAQEQPAPEKAPAAALAVSKSPEPAQAVNVRLELTITDQAGGTPPATRTVTMLTADRSVNRIRTVTTSVKAGELNVDARPQILQADRIQLNLTVEYRPGVSGASETAPHTSQSLVVILQDGKPLLLSQTADPNSDRKVRLEVKATILR